MLVHHHELLRAHPWGTSAFDLRHIVILGAQSTGTPYPLPLLYPTIADFSKEMPGWCGALVLGNTTERLYRHFGTQFQVVKLCAVYPAGEESVAMEYLAIVDPEGYHLVFKCRIHRLYACESLVLANLIDNFTHGLSSDAWFENPLVAALGAQDTMVDDMRQFAIDSLVCWFNDRIPNANFLVADCYDPYTVVDHVQEMLTMLDRVAQSPSQADSILPPWAMQLVQLVPQEDLFLHRVLTGQPLGYNDIAQGISHHGLDLSMPAPLTAPRDLQIHPLPLLYLPIAQLIERLKFTDFTARLPCDKHGYGIVEVLHVSYRFANIWPLQQNHRDHIALTTIFVKLYTLYHNVAPYVAMDLIEIRITKSFNEEAMIEFSHQNPYHDHVMYIDFAMLSYCSCGLGRAFVDATDIPR